MIIIGSGSWSSATYSAATAYRASTGKSAFDYSDTTITSTPRTSWKAHEDLDPKGITRESRDSDEHPTSVPIAVIFDETGSMGGIPRVLQQKLTELFGLLLRKGYVEHPQIMYGAVGDANSDKVPFQIGQFESDNRSDEDLGKIFLEGNGGGQRSESYELAMYFMARHTVTDAWEKRGQRGLLFIIGDEDVYTRVSPAQVRQVFGDELTESLSTKQLVAELQEKWDTYFIIPQHGSYWNDASITQNWRDLLGQNVILLDDETAVCETIGLAIGLALGTVDLEDGLDDLKDVGVSDAITGKVGKALAHIGAGKGGAVAKVAGNLPAVSADDDLDRL